MVKKEIIIGLITGFVANISGLVLAILFLNDNPSIIEIVVKYFEERLLSKLIIL